MYILDAHIHMEADGTRSMEANWGQFLSGTKTAGVSGGVILSPDPTKPGSGGPASRLAAVLDFCQKRDNLFPFLWIDPMADHVLDQMDEAAGRGIAGFKIICSGFYPGDSAVIAACTKAAELNKPVLFHSGILWDGRDSSRYNRPGEFEALLEVPKLRFCLAHISWPWTDECIAVYGKFSNALALRPELSCEMFIDLTPGTPRIYRRDALEKLFGSGYQVKYNVMFGSDCTAERYNGAWAAEWTARDTELIRQCVPDDCEDTIEHIYAKNLLRFLGKSKEHIVREYPQTAETPEEVQTP